MFESGTVHHTAIVFILVFGPLLVFVLWSFSSVLSILLCKFWRLNEEMLTLLCLFLILRMEISWFLWEVFSVFSLLLCMVLASNMDESSCCFWNWGRNSVHRLVATLTYTCCRDPMKSVGKWVRCDEKVTIMYGIVDGLWISERLLLLLILLVVLFFSYLFFHLLDTSSLFFSPCLEVSLSLCFLPGPGNVQSRFEHNWMAFSKWLDYQRRQF